MIKDLSIIIVAYNNAFFIEVCLKKLINSLKKEDFSWEIIIIDNGSYDRTIEIIKSIKEKNKNIILIENKKNLGFSKANNQGIKKALGRYILFLNSDVLVEKIYWQKLINFIEKNKDIGALTVKVKLQNGQIDLASHRGFPNLWRSFCYFSFFERFFSFNLFFKKIFGGYHLLHLNFNKIHEVEAISGAFFLTRKKIMEKLGGFDEDFFMYGEDLDLCLRIKKLNYKIIYYPDFEVLHLKYQSGLKSKDQNIKIKTKSYFFQAMKIFYKKHYTKRYPFFINLLFYLIINWKIKSYEKNRY